MNIKELIMDIKIKGYEYRIESLRPIDKECVVINMIKRKMEEVKKGNFKVNGMARKYKVGDVNVVDFKRYECIVNTFNKGKRETFIYQIYAGDGRVYYYDTYNNKLGKSEILRNVEFE